MGTLAKIFLPSLDWRTKALRGNFGEDFPAILGLTKKSSTWELWQRFSCHPWTDEEKLYVGTLAKIFLPSLDWQTKALRGNFGKDFPAILGLTNKSSTWELWQRFSCHPWTDEQKLYMGTLAKIFLPSLDWRTKALRGNFGKDFPAILGLTNKSSTWELWQRFSCHPWTWRTKALHGNFGKDFPAILGLTNKSSTWELWQDFPAILGLTNKSSMWELWQRFSCHPWTDEQKLYVGTLAKICCHPWTDEQKLYIGTLAKIFLPSLDCQTKALRGNIGKRFSCHPWTDEGELYVGTLAKIFLPSLDYRTKALRGNIAKIFLPSLDWRTKALCGNFGKDFSAILRLSNGKDFPAILRLSNGKDFPAILGLTNESSTWELWQRFSCHPWTDERKLYVGTLAKIFLPSLDWRTKALRGNFGKDFPAILGLTNKSSTWELWQRFSCHSWTDERKLYVGTLAKIFLPSLDWRMKALRGNFGKDFPAILGLMNKSSTWELWQRFSCHPWTKEQKLYMGTLAKVFLPSLD